MYYSDDLRIKLSKKFLFDLEHYVWNDELNDYLMKIKLNYFENLITTMDEVYEYGFNIGLCGLTSRYFAVAFPSAKLAYGTLPILKGTKNCKNGNHAWIIKDGFVIDSTLRLIIPETKAEEIGYTVDKILADSSARYFSENELYSTYVLSRQNDSCKYHQQLLKIE